MLIIYSINRNYRVSIIRFDAELKLTIGEMICIINIIKIRSPILMELMKREEQWQLTVVVDVLVDKIDYGNGCSGATTTYGHKNFLNYKAWSFVPFRGLALVRNSPVQERKKEF